MDRPRTIAISVNTSWNLLNFRRGLLRAMDRAGYRVVAISPRDGYETKLAEIGVEHIPIHVDRQGLSPFRDLALTVRYHSILKRLKPDVFLGYTVKPNIYGSIAAHLLDIPTLNNVAGLGTAFIRGGLLSQLVTALYRRALRRSRVVFFQNADDQALFIEAGIVRADQSRLIPGSGIDLDHYAPDYTPAVVKADTTFLLIARLLRDKGVVEYAEAARLLRAERPDVRFQLLGAAGDSNRTAISLDQVQIWAREGAIEYLGATDDVRPFIRSADCVVLPSYREGLPRVLLEAGALCRPLIATDVPGCRDVVSDGINGWLCAPASSAALADAMRRFAELPAPQRAEMGLASRRKVEQTFDERIVIDAYLAAIDYVLAVS